MVEGDNGTTGGRPTSTPNPDPTILTTEALIREVSALNTTIDLRIKALSDIMAEKFIRTDAQFQLVERQRVEQKNDTKAAVDAALTAQKEAVKEQTTAFATATGKSEDSVFKQIDQISLNAKTAQESLRRSIDELKDRFAEDTKNIREYVIGVERKIDASLSVSVGHHESKTGLYAGIAAAGVVVGVIVSIISILASGRGA